MCQDQQSAIAIGGNLSAPNAGKVRQDCWINFADSGEQGEASAAVSAVTANAASLSVSSKRRDQSPDVAIALLVLLACVYAFMRRRTGLDFERT